MIGKGDQTRSNLFYLDIEDATCLVVGFDDVWLWHKRLCYVNFDNLVSISNMKKVRGFPKLKKPNNTMCKQCQLGKMTKLSFKSKIGVDQLKYKATKEISTLCCLLMIILE